MNKYLLFLILITLFLNFTTQQEVGVSTNTFDSQVDNLVWCGNNRVQNEEDETIVLEDVESRITNIMFMNTNKGEVFATNSHGEKWSNMTSLVYSQLKVDKSQKLNFNSLKVSPADPKTVFMFGTNGISIIAKDCGKKLKLIKHDPDYTDFKLNRQNSDLILAHKAVKCNQFDDECEAGEKQLHVSKDQGKTWDKILDNVYEAHWDKLVHFSLVPDERIIAHQRIYYAGKDNDQKMLTYSDDFYKTKKQIDSNVLHFYQSNFYLFVLTNSDQSDSYTLKTAPAFSQDYKPQEIDLPVNRIKDHSFTVLDSIQGQLYLAINHQGHQSKITNVYQSDFNGKKFSLSLMNVVRNVEGNVDFEKISSHEGSFIANVYDSAELEKILAKQDGKTTSKFDRSQIKGNKQFVTMQDIKKTMITYNRGATWHPLKAPLKNYKGEDYNCSGECSLHLKGRTDKYGNNIYASESAPGLILGTGNVGLYLENKEENLNTYLSNDGGHTWYEIKDKPHTYEIADRGGLIVLGRSDMATNHILYSWDHGKSWQKEKISDSVVDIVNIVTEQSNMTQRFLIFEKKDKIGGKAMQGLVTALDFSKLHQRVCTGHWDPLDPESDFEFWTPINYMNEKCLFGSKIKYIRRKQDAQCFNPEEFDTVSQVESCECTEEDFQCTFGYYRDEEQNNKCVPMSNKFGKQKEELERQPPAKCNGHYLVPTGYERIPANYCQGGVDLGPIRKECPVPEKEKTQEYIPFEEEEHEDLDSQHSNILTEKQKYLQKLEKEKKEKETENNEDKQGFFTKNWPIFVGLIVIYFIYTNLTTLVNIFVIIVLQVKELFASKNKNSNGYQQPQSNLGSNYENLGLVGGRDMDEDEEEQL